MNRRLAFFIPLLVIVGCAEESAKAPIAEQPPVKIERIPYPDFTLTTLNGKKWKLSEHIGKPIVVNYWATWCGPCRAETPYFVEINNKFGSKVEFVGISTDRGPVDSVKQFVKAEKIPYPVAVAPTDDPLASHVGLLPTTYILDKKGRIFHKFEGAANPNQLVALLSTLAAE